VTVLDFDASDFAVTSSPAGEANISLAYGTGAGTPAEGNHTHANYVQDTGDTIAGPVTIQSDSGNALLIEAAGGTDRFNVNGTTGAIESVNGGFMRGYSDNYSTTTWQILSSTGEVLIGGPLNHDGTTIGFYGATPVTKPTVSGAKGGNAALTSLMTALANLGIVTNSTT
jgi:hypothetical protein